jgi:hypothetical protein
VLLYTIDSQQSNLVCCHNHSLAVAFPGFLNIASVSGIVNVMPLAYILGPMEAIIIAQWAQ